MSQSFAFFQKFLKERSGLVITTEKQYLLESRLLPIARKAGMSGLDQLATELAKPANTKLQNDVVEAMTTNESFFFRDKTPFDHFEKEMMPKLIEARAVQKRIRVWCAAASTGQEPYSLAMIVKEMAAKLGTTKVEITGTDISNEVLERARNGLYSQFEVQRGLPVQLLLKYFEQVGENWQIAPSIRLMVQYRNLNLLDSFSTMGQFDIIYCRNVLIYFDQETKKQILERMAKQLAPDGYLVLGAAETVVGITDAFKPTPDKRGLYSLSTGQVVPLSKAGVA